MRPRPFTRYVTGSSISESGTRALVRGPAAAGAAAAAAAGGGHRKGRELAPGTDRREAGDLDPCPAGLAARADLAAIALGERGQHLEAHRAGVTAILVYRHRREL